MSTSASTHSDSHGDASSGKIKLSFDSRTTVKELFGCSHNELSSMKCYVADWLKGQPQIKKLRGKRARDLDPLYGPFAEKFSYLFDKQEPIAIRGLLQFLAERHLSKQRRLKKRTDPMETAPAQPAPVASQTEELPRRSLFLADSLEGFLRIRAARVGSVEAMDLVCDDLVPRGKEKKIEHIRLSGLVKILAEEMAFDSTREILFIGDGPLIIPIKNTRALRSVLATGYRRKCEAVSMGIVSLTTYAGWAKDNSQSTPAQGGSSSTAATNTTQQMGTEQQKDSSSGDGSENPETRQA